MKKKIRKVTGNDLDRCCQIEAAEFPPGEAASKGKILKRIQEFSEGFYVVEIDGDVVGFINSGATDKPDLSDEEFKELVGHNPDGKSVVVMSVVVHKTMQGKGLGEELMHQFIREMKQQHRHEIFLMCKAELEGFYHKFGFELRKMAKSSHGGSDWSEMWLKLDA